MKNIPTLEHDIWNINYTLQMFGGIYRDFAGKSECGDFKFTGIACIPLIPVIFEVNQKKKCGLFIYTLFQISLYFLRKFQAYMYTV